MEARKPLWNHIGTAVGLLCLGAMLAILPLGVRAVRAGEGAETLMSVDPLLVSGTQVATPDAPLIPLADIEESIKPGSPGVEVQPGVIVLNTRGYNYGSPPATIDPAAMNLESQ